MSDSLYVPRHAVRVETEVKKSRFICELLPCDSKSHIKTILAGIKKEIPDSNHHCWAYQIGPANSLLQACSDDGEPQGTAGRPMLNVLSHSKLTNVLAVVSRIFGGTKLGTGGLARAYSQAVNEALKQLQTMEYIHWQRLEMTLDYANENQVRHILRSYDFDLEKSDHSKEVFFAGRVDVRVSDDLIEKLQRLTLSLERIE